MASFLPQPPLGLSREEATGKTRSENRSELLYYASSVAESVRSLHPLPQGQAAPPP